MKLNVNSVLKRNEIRALLEAQEKPKYEFVKMNTNVEMQFDVSDYDEIGADNVPSYTKGLIKKEPYGKMINVGVLIDGQLFSGDPRWREKQKA